MTIEFSRTGGIAGLDDHMTITTDRKVTISRRGAVEEFTLDQESYDQIIRQFEKSGFVNRQTRSQPDNVIFDRISFSVTYKGHTENPPDSAAVKELEPVIGPLVDVLDKK